MGVCLFSEAEPKLLRAHWIIRPSFVDLKVWQPCNMCGGHGKQPGRGRLVSHHTFGMFSICFFWDLASHFFDWATVAPKRPGLDTPVAHDTGGIRELSLSLDVACATSRCACILTCADVCQVPRGTRNL